MYAILAFLHVITTEILSNEGRYMDAGVHYALTVSFFIIVVFVWNIIRRELIA